MRLLQGMRQRLLPGNRQGERPFSGGRTIPGVQREKKTRWHPQALVVVLLFGIITGLMGWGVHKIVVRSDVFRLTEVEVHGNMVTTTQQLLDTGAIEQGQSLVAVDCGEVAGAIARLPWIDKVKVKKHWPSALEISVKEHRPLALVHHASPQGSNLYYANSRGELFARLQAGQDYDFPVITGGKTERIGAYERLTADSPSASALLLLKLAAKGNAILPVQSISEVHVDPREGLVVYLVDHPFPIYFGVENVHTKYYRLVKILERLYRKEQITGISSIRMDYMENKILVARAELDR